MCYLVYGTLWCVLDVGTVTHLTGSEVGVEPNGRARIGPISSTTHSNNNASRLYMGLVQLRVKHIVNPLRGTPTFFMDKLLK